MTAILKLDSWLTLARENGPPLSRDRQVAALKRHLVEKVAISEICNELQIAPTVFYGWLKTFFENGHVAFENGRKGKAEDTKEKKIEQLHAKLQRKNEVMAELLEEHTLLKKEFGEL